MIDVTVTRALLFKPFGSVTVSRNVYVCAEAAVNVAFAVFVPERLTI